MVPFNINDEVRVKLTDYGRAKHREWHDRLFSAHPREKRDEWYRAPVEDDEGWSTWQLWTLMQEVGWACCIGGTGPFETTIQIAIREG